MSTRGGWANTFFAVCVCAINQQQESSVGIALLVTCIVNEPNVPAVAAVVVTPSTLLRDAQMLPAHQVFWHQRAKGYCLFVAEEKSSSLPSPSHSNVTRHTHKEKVGCGSRMVVTTNCMQTGQSQEPAARCQAVVDDADSYSPNDRALISRLPPSIHTIIIMWKRDPTRGRTTCRGESPDAEIAIWVTRRVSRRPTLLEVTAPMAAKVSPMA